MNPSSELHAEIDRLLALAGSFSHVELAEAWGNVTASLVGKLRRGWKPNRMDAHRRAAMKRLLCQLEEQELGMPGSGYDDYPAELRAKALDGGREAPAPTFVEHVLFTAGRIAELANQIAQAAAQQQRVTRELGQRAQAEGQGPPPVSASVTRLPKHHPGKGKKGGA